MLRNHGYTLVEMLAAFAIALVALSLFEAASNGHRRTSRQMQNNTQLRGIHQAMVMYAQGNGSRFPGLDRGGHDAGVSVEHRMWVLLNDNYFTGEYAISPAETKTAWTTGTVTTDHYSHAMLQLPYIGTRRAEWAETLNTDAIVMSDRNVGTVEAPRSINPPRTNGWGCTERVRTWSGGMVYNDNHVVYESSHRQPTVMSGVKFASDHIFTAEGGSDAWMIYSGDGR